MQRLQERTRGGGRQMGNPLNCGRVSALSVADVTPGWHALDESRAVRSQRKARAARRQESPTGQWTRTAGSRMRRQLRGSRASTSSRAAAPRETRPCQAGSWSGFLGINANTRVHAIEDLKRSGYRPLLPFGCSAVVHPGAPGPRAPRGDLSCENGFRQRVGERPRGLIKRECPLAARHDRGRTSVHNRKSRPRRSCP